MDLEVTHIRSMDVGRYIHNYEGFYEKFTYQMCINKGRMITPKGAHASLVGILSFLLSLSLSLSLLVKSFEGEIQPFGVSIPLEARHLNSFKKYFKGTL